MNSGHQADAAADALELQTLADRLRAAGRLPVEPAPIRVAILDMAKQAITVDRAATHGNAENNFGTIAAYWSAHLDVNVTAQDVATMMVLFKMARAKSNGAHLDNWTDAVGYAALGAEIAGAHNER